MSTTLNMFKILDSNNKQVGSSYGNYLSAEREKNSLEQTGIRNLKIVSYEVKK